MKWTNPGHQLDDLGKRYLRVRNLYICGTDEAARKAYDFLVWLGVADEFKITFLVGEITMARLAEPVFCEKPVVLFSDVHKVLPEDRLEAAVMLPSLKYTERRQALEQLGVENIFYLRHSHNRRDNFIQNFVCVWMMYKTGKLVSHWTNYVVTLRCTLNCKGCLNFNDFIHNPTDTSFKDFKEHFDILFSKFDYLYSLHFTGGEPQLAKQLPEMMRYLAENYGDRIFDFFLITNGTIVPQEATLSALKLLHGRVLIDDYRKNVRNTKIDEVVSTLCSNGIDYTLGAAPFWYDLDIDGTDYSHLPEVELERHKDDCHSFLHEFGEKRIYACCYQQYAHRAGLCDLDGANDYIEIATTPKMEILEFRQGYTKKGYVDFCKRCRGLGTNAKKMEPAVQVPRRQGTSSPSEQG